MMIDTNKRSVDFTLSLEMPTKKRVVKGQLDDLREKCFAIFERLILDYDLIRDISCLNKTYSTLALNLKPKRLSEFKLQLLNQVSSIAHSYEGLFFKPLLLLRLASIQARINPKQAIDTANSILDPLAKVFTFRYITENLALTHPQELLAITLLVKDAISKALVFSQIAQIQAKINPEQAQVYLQQALKNATEIKQECLDTHACVLSEIVRMQVQVHFNQAIVIANAIEKSCLEYKILAFCEIFRAQAKTNSKQAQIYLTKAFHLAETQSSQYHTDQALCEIVKAQAHVNLEQALKTAKSIKFENIAARALYEIIKTQAHVNLEQALTIAQSIPQNMQDERGLAFYEIVKAQAQVNLKQALTTAHSMGIFQKYQAFCEIIKAQAQQNLEQAIETAKTIENQFDKGVFCEIIKIQLHTQFSQAKKRLRDILDSSLADTEKFLCLADILESLITWNTK